jgi:hypothetical protein
MTKPKPPTQQAYAKYCETYASLCEGCEGGFTRKPPWNELTTETQEAWEAAGIFLLRLYNEANAKMQAEVAAHNAEVDKARAAQRLCLRCSGRGWYSDVEYGRGPDFRVACESCRGGIV